MEAVVTADTQPEGRGMALTRTQKAWRKRWSEALRSGEYKQGRGALQNGNGFCCLGVACDVADRSKWGEPEPGDFRVPYHVMLGCWPNEVARLFGVDAIDENEFVAANDTNGFTFDEIADVIDFMTLAGV